MATPAGRTALLPWPCFSRHKSPTWLFRLDNNNLCCDGRGTCLVGKKSKAMESFGGEIGAEIGLQRNLTMTSQNAWRVCTWKLELPPTGAGCGSGPRGVAMTYCKRGSACMDRTRRYLLLYASGTASTTVALSWSQTTWMGALQQKTDSFFGIQPCQPYPTSTRSDTVAMAVEWHVLFVCSFVSAASNGDETCSSTLPPSL